METKNIFPDEGYIKFGLEWKKTPPLEGRSWKEINRFRTWLYKKGLIGQYSNGVGFGNLSMGSRRRFLISGTQTGGRPRLDSRHYTWVTGYCIDHNQVFCQGPVKASSESLTHAAFYSAWDAIGAVIHVHHREKWNDLKGRMPTTDSSIPYGTPAMAETISNLLEEKYVRQKRMILMGGHEEGIITFGRDMKEALRSIKDLFGF